MANKTENEIEFDIMYKTISTLNVAAHGIGIYLLCTIFRGARNSTQRVLILNMSASELICNAISFIQMILTYSGEDTKSFVILCIFCITNI